MICSRSKGLFVLFLFLASFNKVAGQDNSRIDSLLRELNRVHDTVKVTVYSELYRETFHVDLEMAEKYALGAMRAGSTINHMSSKAKGHNLLGVHFLQKSEYDSAYHHLDIARGYFEQLNQAERLIMTLNNMAIVLQNKGNLDKSLEMHLEVLRLVDSVGVEGDSKASNYWNIGNVHLNLDNPNQAIIWFEKSKQIYTGLSDTFNMVELTFQLALAQMNLSNYEESETGFLYALDYYQQNNMTVAEAGTRDNLGDIYVTLGRYQEAEEMLTKGLSLAESSGAPFLLGQIYRRLAKLYVTQNQWDKAEKYALLSMENAEQYSRNKKVIKDYEMLSHIYENQGDFQSSLLYYKKYFIQNDSIFGLEKLKSINNLQLEYERYKNEKEVEILEERNKRSKLRNRALWIGLALLVALFGAILYAFRQKLHNSKLYRLQVEQELEHKKQELIAFALQLAHKNEVLEDVKTSITDLKESQNKSMNSIIKKINFNKNDERSWGEFRERFVAVHKNFESDIQERFPDVTASELRLMALIKMTLTNKEIASILNISPAGIKKARYRLRKKLGLNTGDSLEKFIYTI